MSSQAIIIAPSIKLTAQELNIVNYCSGKPQVPYEELAQFSKEPATVKLKTIQKTISDLKKKYRDANLILPFNCVFIQLAKTQDKPLAVSADKLIPSSAPVEQKLVQLRMTRGGNRVPMDNKQPDVHIDFKLEPLYKRVRTKSEVINLSDNEWELFTFLHSKAEKTISIEEMKDVVYKNFGSKTPAGWADSIKRTLSKLRRNIHELKTQERLMTIIGSNTTYYMLK